MNILFTICARAGSKGLSGKNTKYFCGKPLANYTLAAFELFKKKYNTEYNDIMLAINTDSDLLLEQVKCTGVKFLFIDRNENLAGDLVAKKDVIRDTLKKCENIKNKKFDVVVDLDLTSPLRKIKDIKGTIESLQNNKEADLAYSVTASRRSPYFNMVTQKKDGYYHTVIESEYVARQEVPVCYDMNASVYAYRRKYLVEDKCCINRKAVIWRMQDTAVLDIDSETDLELMEVIGKYIFEHDEEYRKIATFSLKD